MNNHIIIIGNEKGGAGKTTCAMHIIASLLDQGAKVASMDVDSRQLSLTRYIENRKKTIAKTNIPLPLSTHYIVPFSTQDNIKDIEAEEARNFNEILDKVKVENDFIVIDTPGSNSFLSRHAHSYADTIVTPINDSFVDVDLLAKISVNNSTTGNFDIERPSIYSQMVWEQKIARAKRDNGSIDWVVMRNRLSPMDARNKRNVSDVLEKLAKRVGYRLSAGFSERVIFRELFIHGLTLLDLNKKIPNIPLAMTHIAARQELRELIKVLNLQDKFKAKELIES